MTAQAMGKAAPRVFTLDDVATLNAADEYGHRYELSPGGGVSIMPPAGSGHAVVATRLLAWFVLAGWPSEQVMQVAGIRVPGPDGDGGRIPDLTVWSRPQPDVVWIGLADLLLVVEIVSPGSERTDQMVKVQEYAQAGIPRYWVVERDTAQTVTMYTLGPNNAYEWAAKMPLALLLDTKPTDYLGV
jgi:Uma2 family endonuclease